MAETSYREMLETLPDPLQNETEAQATTNTIASAFAETPPSPKFNKCDRVYARDNDGVCYEAVVRRRLYGIHRNRQVPLGLVENSDEADTALQKEDEPVWHYFVHYQKWNVNWDRWVPEHNVFDHSVEMQTYAARLAKEIAELKKVLSRKAKGKKAFQTIDGVEFLRAWTKKRAEIDAEFKLGQIKEQGVPADVEFSDVKVSKKPQFKHMKEGWTRQNLEAELSLRQKSLTNKRAQSNSNKISLPFALKRVLVEDWEIICQCEMVPQLPTSVTIRQALTQYLSTKNLILPDERNKDLFAPLENEANEEEGIISLDSSIAETVDTKHSCDDNNSQEWIDMANGMMMFFDEALPVRLLYEAELPQVRVMNQILEYAQVRDVDIYGCEYLLRLLVRLPDLVASGVDEVEARSIFAKINDFVRFLHKNQATLLKQNFRKLNNLEVKERQKMLKRAEERKRKGEAIEDHSEATYP